MSKPLREARLPDGTKVFCLRPYEVRVVHSEMAGYFRHGITVRDGDVVFDVGANIGLFGLWALKLANVSVYSFEPIPAVFRALEANAARFAPGRWSVFNCGLGRRPGMATFGYHKHVTVWSSPYPDDSPAERELLRSAALRNLTAYPRPICWFRWLPGPLRRRLIDLALDRAFRFKPVACPVRTVSDILRERRIPRIDLLKIDVQRGEWDVFEGVEEDDWERIRQVVAEVHDLHDRRVQRTVGLLKRHGFDAITLQQEPMLQGTDIYNLFARRTVPMHPRAQTTATEEREEVYAS
jgi:FkbM family methyltransferase